MYNLGFWIYLECLYKDVRFNDKNHDAVKETIRKDFERGGVYANELAANRNRAKGRY